MDSPKAMKPHYIWDWNVQRPMHSNCYLGQYREMQSETREAWAKWIRKIAAGLEKWCAIDSPDAAPKSASPP